MSDTEEDSTSSPSSSEWPVTEQWLEAVLRHHHRQSNGAGEAAQPPLPEEPGLISIVDFTARPGCDAGESVLSDILAVNVEYRLGHAGDEQENRSLSFIIKLLPQDPFSRFFVVEAQFDLREIKFYTQVVPDLERFQKQNIQEDATPIKLPIPKCYHAHYVPSTDTGSIPSPPESVLVLENIRPRGYSTADFSKGLTLHQVTAAVDAIASIHALSLCYKVKEDKILTEHYPFLFQTASATDSYQQLVERGLPQLAKFLEKRPGLEEVLEDLNALKASTKDLIASLLAPEEPFGLITHTDFWCNNLMFKDGEDDTSSCIILDWQMATYSRPTNDLALLFISSVPSDLRREQTDSLLDHYWAKLTETCQKFGINVESQLGYGRAKLAEDYKRSQLLALLLCVGSVDVALGNPLTEKRMLDVLQDLHKDGVLGCSPTGEYCDSDNAV